MKYRIEYTDELPSWVGGRCTFPVLPYFGMGTCTIKIKYKYKDDLGLLNHEIEHARQYKNNWFHVVKYKFSKKYRFESELKAYKMQILTYQYKQISQCKWIIDTLFSKYNLEIDKDVITKRVRELLDDR